MLPCELKLKRTTALPTFQFSVPDSTARPTAITMAPKRIASPAKRTDGQAAGATATIAAEALKEMARPLQAASLARTSQKTNTPAEAPEAKRARLCESEQNADAAPSTLQQKQADPALPVPAVMPTALSPAETNQPAPAGAAESKLQEACNK